MLDDENIRSRSAQESMTQSSTTRLILLALGLIWCVYRIWSKNPFTFMHHIHLPIHEAGHMIFMILGEFLYILGGSLFQVIFPMVFSVSFALRKDYFAACLVFLWAGDSLIDVSYYVADAYRQQLPLIGGEHDWAVLLGMLDLTHHADFLGGLCRFAGAMIMLAGWLSAALYANHQAAWIKIKN